MNRQTDLKDNSPKTGPCQTRGEIAIAAYPEWLFGYIDDQKNWFDDGSIPTHICSRINGPERLLTWIVWNEVPHYPPEPVFCSQATPMLSYAFIGMWKELTKGEVSEITSTKGVESPLAVLKWQGCREITTVIFKGKSYLTCRLYVY